jgi:cytochrome P450 family 110
MAFALFEMKVVMATVLSMTRMRLAVPKVEVARRGFFLAPKGGPPTIVESRTPSATAVA